MIDDRIWEELKKVPEGERSWFINKALSHELLYRKRVHEIRLMDRLRLTGQSVEIQSENLCTKTGIAIHEVFFPDVSVLLKWVLPGEMEPHRDKTLSVFGKALFKAGSVFWFPACGFKRS